MQDPEIKETEGAADISNKKKRRLIRLPDLKQIRNREIALKGGSYSMAATAVVLAILIVVNILFSILPSSVTKMDISSSKLYSITSSTKVVVNNLEQDVTIYWIVQDGKEDSVLENLLSKYESQSSHIKVEKKNPDVYPTFTDSYTDEEVYNNSLVVECGDKSRYISYSSIYESDIDYTTYSEVYSFDGEGAITSAIDYVVSEEHPHVYMLSGHGEADLSSEFEKQLERENMETVSFSLLNEDEIPEDADCILINAPTSDISAEEEKILAEYVSEGGKLMVMSGYVQGGMLTNLYSLLNEYGVTAAEGIVVEGDREHYAFQQSYIMLPDLQSSEITDPLIEKDYIVIAPLAQGLTVGSTDKGEVTALLTTSADAYSKTAGNDLTTYDKEEGDTDGPFSVAVFVEDNGGGQIIWISSPELLDETMNAYSSGANLDFVMNGFSALIGESEAVAIRSKSLSYNYLTISESSASILKAGMIVVLPAIFVVAGIVSVLERRRCAVG